MNLGLRNKVALVTAASKGIGRASAFALAREGAKLAICARGIERLEETAAQIRAETGTEVLAMAADLGSGTDLRRFVDGAATHFGALNVLVAIAGQPPRGELDEITDEQLRQSFEVTVMAMIHLIRATVPHMKAAGGGRIVTVQSRAAKEPVPDHVTSNATRPGVAGLFKDLSRSLPKQGICINTILPGRIETERFREGAQRSPLGVEEYYRRQLRDVPLNRYGHPDDVADAVSFLASERAAYINGAMLQVDGGLMRTIW
jgi:3-oxoacyl-[acyl-carrier protein] reductase